MAEDRLFSENSARKATGRLPPTGARTEVPGQPARHHAVDPKTGEGGTRIAIVFNGSPLFTCDAGSGESSIRRWIIENDRLEAIVAVPDELFYNTGVSTYVSLVTNRKRAR